MVFLSNSTGAFRWALVSVLALVLIFALFIAYQRERTFGVGVQLALPMLILAAAPYLYILKRLAGGSDPRGLGFAVVVGVVAIGLIAIAGLMLFSISPFAAIVAMPFYAIAGLYVLAQAQLIRYAVVEMSRGAGFGSSLVAAVLPSIVFGAVSIFFGAGIIGANADILKETSYSETTAQAHLLRVYKCLVPEGVPAGSLAFPAGLDALQARSECWDAARGPGGSQPGTSFEFRYQARASGPDGAIRGFVMETKKVSRPGAFTDSWSLDESGNVRRSTLDWATVDGRLQSHDKGAVTAIIGMCDAYRELHGFYPDSLIVSRGEVAPPRFMPLPHNSYIAATEVDRRADGTQVVMEGQRRPLLTYERLSDSSYRVTYRARREHIHDLRSYLVDDAGLHMTAEARDATPEDPLHATPEVQKAIAEHRRWALEFLSRATVVDGR